jgi:hypothetical protein
VTFISTKTMNLSEARSGILWTKRSTPHVDQWEAEQQAPLHDIFKTAPSMIFGSIGGGASEVMCDVIARLEGF